MLPPADRAGDSRSAIGSDAHRSPLDSTGRFFRLGLTARAALALLLLFCERLLVLNLVHRGGGIPDGAQFGAALGIPNEWRFPFLLSFGVCLFAFWIMRRDPELEAAARAAPLRPRWLAAHVLLLGCLVPSLHSLYVHHSTASTLTPLVAAGSVLLTAAAAATLASYLAPPSIWLRAARSLGLSWLYSALAATAAIGGMQLSEKLWAPTAGVTFGLVKLILYPFVDGLRTDTVHRVLYVKNFAVEIREACSGLEGAGMMLVFCAAWLVSFRKDYVFPRALALIPASLAVIFLLNVVRIAVLVLIGNAGFSDQAIAGFHSNAGWMAFNAAACGVAFVSRRSGWLTREAPTRSENPTAPYLIPMAVILLVGLITRSLSPGFDTFYAARLIAAAIAIALCWRRLTGLDWRWSWRGLGVGAVMFACWVAAAQFLTTPQGMPADLAAFPDSERFLWIAARLLAAVATVPIAEELAYRGFLMRRIADPDFTAVRFASVGVWPIVISSVLFGLSHGAMWLPGMVAGAAYALLLRQTGRIGEAVAAHATTNLLLGAWVLLASQQWQLW